MRVPWCSVAWVHPSWRDLVIDHLAADAAPAARFLTPAGSTARCWRCPLERRARSASGRCRCWTTDADWDALTDRLRRLVDELAPDELAALLRTVAEAARWSMGPERTEAQALGRTLLERVRRRLDAGARERHPADPEVLIAWMELAQRVPERPPAPAVGAALVARAPVLPLDLARVEDCERVDDWLRLVEAVSGFAPEAVAHSGGLRTYVADLAAMLSAAAIAQDTYAATLDRVLAIERRLRRLGIALGPTGLLDPAAEVLGGGDGDAEDAPEAEPLLGGSGTIVDRVLADL